MSNLYVLKWNAGEKWNGKTFVDVFLINDNSIYCVNFYFDDLELKHFKSGQNKNEFINKLIEEKNYLLLEDITNHPAIDNFIKKNKLEKKIRDWKINRLIE